MKTTKKEKGAVIVEATLVIPMFIFLVITLMWVANLCTAQAKIQIAINSAAKEISSYSYLYGLTGINEMRAELYEKGETGRSTASEAITGVKDIYSALSDISDAGSQAFNGAADLDDIVSGAQDGYQNMGSGISSLNNVYETIKKDPKSFLLSFCSAAAGNGIDKISSTVAGAMGKCFAEKHLTTEYLTADEHLRKLGVVNGLNGIDFSASRFCNSGGDEIIITAQYQLRPIQFFNIDVKYTIVQTGRTRAWFGQMSKDDK